jgi:hypothetical protein
MSNPPTPPTPPSPAIPPTTNGHTTPTSVKPPLRALLTGLIDYAGLFPPAKLPMPPAVENYARYLTVEHHWMLGRFICPVSRLEEFRAAAKNSLPGLDDVVERAVADEADEPLPTRRPQPSRKDDDDPTTAYDHFPGWRLSALIDGELDENLDAIFAFNHEHSRPENGLAVIDAIELKATTPTGIDEALDLIPDELFPFFELPIGKDADIRGFLTALAGSDAGAKIRTGGVTPEAFPTPQAVADFIAACHAAEVPFKATAGLHHPIRAEYNLTYEPNCPRGVMHGFLNVFLAAAFLNHRKIDAKAAAQLLEERDAKSITATDSGIRWRTHELATYEIDQTRRAFALSYGSCSFEEPIDDLKNLRLL